MKEDKTNYSGRMKVSSGIIEFYRKGNAVYVPLSMEMEVSNKRYVVKATGIAKCSPEDKFNLKYGVRKAYLRALVELQNKVTGIIAKSKDPIVEIKKEIKQLRNELGLMEAKFLKETR